MGDLLSKDFRAAAEQLFSADGLHPSAAGYALATTHLLPELLVALGQWDEPRRLFPRGPPRRRFEGIVPRECASSGSFGSRTLLD